MASSRSLAGAPVVDADALDIFVSDPADNAVDVYTGQGKPLYALTGFSGPQGLATDIAGSLYVADTSNSRIVVFAKPHGGSPTALSDDGEYPASVAVAPGSGLVAAINVISTSGGNGNVAIYRKGDTSPCVTVANPAHFSETFFGAFNATGNLFLDGTDSKGGTALGEVSGGCSATKIEALTYKGDLGGFPGGIAVNTKGQIVVAGANGLYTFAKPVHGSLGNPLRITKLSGNGDVVSFAFTKNGDAFWTTDAGVGGAAEYAYPRGGSPLKTFTLQGEPIGIAVTPAELP